MERKCGSTGQREPRLALNVALSTTLAEQLQTPLGQIHHLTLVLLFKLVVGLDLPVGNLLDHLDNIIRLADKPDKLLILGLEQLEQRPDGNVLECRIAAAEEPSAPKQWNPLGAPSSQQESEHAHARSGDLPAPAQSGQPQESARSGPPHPHHGQWGPEFGEIGRAHV